MNAHDTENSFEKHNTFELPSSTSDVNRNEGAVQAKVVTEAT